MYKLKNKIIFDNQKETAEKIGIDKATLSRVLNKKQSVSKIIAYCIVKNYDINANIEDYFIKEK